MGGSLAYRAPSGERVAVARRSEGGTAEDFVALSSTRFFLLHAAVLPSAMVVLLVVHITLIRLQGVTEFRDERDPAR